MSITWFNYGPEVINVEEGRDAVLPCSLSTKEDIESKVFDWKKDGQNEVFMYDAGIHYNNGRTGQDEQFKGRVSHFHDELKNGNASIIIRNTKMADSGNYTCIFPHLQPSQMFHLQLAVGAAPEPYISMWDVTDSGVRLKCAVRGAFPQPKLQWQDSDGNLLRAEEPQISERGGRYDVTLQTTVTKTKTNRFHCVVKQEDISHMIDANITVPDKLFEDTCSRVEVTEWLLGGFALGVLSLAAVLAFLVATKRITIGSNKGFLQRRNGPSETPLNLPA
ncbi:butyrophilin-like protein 1 [Enoplosus armatus]|uniref:butyrophilin-like protein 1 n=1 Tax=Enoplosus armatus TaxID=215367 RepID=UPI003991C924